MNPEIVSTIKELRIQIQVDFKTVPVLSNVTVNHLFNSMPTAGYQDLKIIFISFILIYLIMIV